MKQASHMFDMLVSCLAEHFDMSDDVVLLELFQRYTSPDDLVVALSGRRFMLNSEHWLDQADLPRLDLDLVRQHYRIQLVHLLVLCCRHSCCSWGSVPSKRLRCLINLFLVSPITVTFQQPMCKDS